MLIENTRCLQTLITRRELGSPPEEAYNKCLRAIGPGNGDHFVFSKQTLSARCLVVSRVIVIGNWGNRGFRMLGNLFGKFHLEESRV